MDVLACIRDYACAANTEREKILWIHSNNFEFDPQSTSVLGDKCSGVPESVSSAPMTVMGQHNSSSDPLGTYKASRDVWLDQGPVARALCVLHVMDYACWTDLPDGIPQFCQDVYAETDFVQYMLNTTYRHEKWPKAPGPRLGAGRRPSRPVFPRKGQVVTKGSTTKNRAEPAVNRRLPTNADPRRPLAAHDRTQTRRKIATIAKTPNKHTFQQ